MLTKHHGFSLLETMLVLILVLTISGAIFQTINAVTQRSGVEQTKTDMFQEAREFMDQMSIDLRGAGYPNPRNLDPSILTQNPIMNDLHAAAGLVAVYTGDLIFEGDVDGTGNVSVIHYHLNTATTNNCPCLQRSSLPKINGDPLTQQTTPAYQTEVQGVLNTNIFAAFTNGAALTLPIDTTTAGASNIAAIDTVQATLSLQASAIDPQTHLRPVTTLATTVRMNNCEQALIGFKTSCQ